MRQVLEDWPEIHAPRMTEILRTHGYVGSERVVRKRLAELRPSAVRPAQRTGYALVGPSPSASPSQFLRRLRDPGILCKGEGRELARRARSEASWSVHRGPPPQARRGVRAPGLAWSRAPSAADASCSGPLSVDRADSVV